jgi:hypothetical protein
MARVRKIDNADLKRFAKSSKKNKPREVKVFFLIVCEGEKTEPNYFKKFKGQFGNVIFEVDCEGKGYNTLQVVEQAIKIRDKNPNKYNRVWAVFDKDSFPDNKFNAAILKAKSNNICCAWSNQAFELWYLLHFLNRTTGMERTEYQKAIENEINQKWKNKKKPFKYKKNAIDMYDVLQQYGNQDQAIKWAQNLSETYDNEKFATHNPRTQVYELVLQLNGKDIKLNEEIKQRF